MHKSFGMIVRRLSSVESRSGKLLASIHVRSMELTMCRDRMQRIFHVLTDWTALRTIGPICFWFFCFQKNSRCVKSDAKWQNLDGARTSYLQTPESLHSDDRITGRFRQFFDSVTHRGEAAHGVIKVFACFVEEGD